MNVRIGTYAHAPVEQQPSILGPVCTECKCTTQQFSALRKYGLHIILG